MADTTVEAHKLTAYKPVLLVEKHKVSLAVAFYKDVFDAIEIGSSSLYPKPKADQELSHHVSTELNLAGTIIVVCAHFEELEASKTITPAILETDDVKAAVAKSVAGGALQISDGSKITDPFGYTWVIEKKSNTGATTSSVSPLEKSVTFTACKPVLMVEKHKVSLAVAFYKDVFDAIEIGSSLDPKRKANQELPHLVSAELKLTGSTIVVVVCANNSDHVEASQSTAILETGDVEAAVAKFVANGALEGSEGISDPFGFTWIFASPAKKRFHQVIVNAGPGQCLLWDCRRRPGQPNYCSSFHAALAAQESTAELPACLRYFVPNPNSRSEDAFSFEEKMICTKAITCRMLHMPSGLTELPKDTLAAAPYSTGLFSTDLEEGEKVKLWFFYYPRRSFPCQDTDTGANWKVNKILEVSAAVESVKRFCSPQPSDGTWSAKLYYPKEFQGAEWSVCCLRYTQK